MQSPTPTRTPDDVLSFLPDDRPVWMVDVQRQRILRTIAGRGWESAAVSTSRFGTGSTPGSNQTPLGLHEVSEVIGLDAEPGQPFKSRVPSGPPLSPAQWQDGSGDTILSRILWLNGLEPGNRTSHARYIYLHGTHQESRLGTPASLGCVRMANRTLIEWVDSLNGTLPYVWIGRLGPVA